MASTATLPAFFTSATRFAGALTRPSSLAKNAIVVSGGTSLSAGARCVSTSASFQRSTPSTMMNRRPTANVIAFSAAPTSSGVVVSPSKTSTASTPDSASAIARSRARRSAIRPCASPWIRYAGFQAAMTPL